MDLVNIMKMRASKQKDKVTSEAELLELNQKISMYCYEEGVLTGRNGDENARESLYDKVFNLYAPIVKEAYAVR